jgi:hypothetical protein
MTAQIAAMSVTPATRTESAPPAPQNRDQPFQHGGRRRWLKPTPQNMQRMNYAQRAAARERGINPKRMLQKRPVETADGRTSRVAVERADRHAYAAARQDISHGYVGRLTSSRPKLIQD